MREILSDSDLHEQLEAFISNASLHLNNYNYCAFHTLWKYGFRMSEIYMMPLATINVDNTATFKTLKNNNERIYPLSSLSGELMFLLSNRFDVPYFMSRQTFAQYLKDLNGGKYFYVGNKDCSTHIFRHNRIKLLSEEGATIAQIKQFTGIKQDQTVLNYIESIIYQ